MDGADLGASQHGENDLWDAPHINRDAVAFEDAHGFDDIGHAVHFAVHRIIGIGLVQFAIFTFPDQCQFIFSIGLEMPVNRVMDNIRFRPDEPFEERFIGIVQNLVPFLEPFQLFGFLGPKRLRILESVFSSRIPIFQDCLRDHVFGWIIDFPFHFFHFSISLCYHKGPPPSELIIWMLAVILPLVS